MSCLILNMASADSHYRLFYSFASWLSGSQKNPIMDNYMIINLWGNVFPDLNSIMVGFCFEMQNILYKYFILITTISKWQKTLLPIQVIIIIIHRYYPYCYLILGRYFLISAPIALIPYSSIQVVSCEWLIATHCLWDVLMLLTAIGN